MKRDEDHDWICEALKEAAKGIGLTAPNPPVGAVLVRDGVELTRGWHQKAGKPHAEREALSKLPVGGAKGATAYVTLEPCSTPGRTGACTDALIEAGITRVVYGCCDPNNDHQGRADAILEAAGIEVRSGVCETECAHLIRGFAMVATEGRPWVIAKTAMSLDGRITRPLGEGQWLTGKEARAEVQALRGEVDAIVTSGETVRQDDPALTIRGLGAKPKKEQPWRVVLTRIGVEEEGHQLFEDVHSERTLVFQNIDEYEVLRTLSRDHGVTSVLLEAGGELLGSFQDKGLIDEWVLYLAPLVTGGPVVAVGGEGSETLEERLSLKEVDIQRVGEDLRARGLVERSGPKVLER